MNKITRREALSIGIGIATAVAISPNLARAHDCALANRPTAEADSDIEMQRGDPALAQEPMPFDPLAVQELIWGVSKASFDPRIASFQQDMLTHAATYEGMNRSNNRPQISKFLELFNLPFQDDGKPLAFCAAGLSYVAAIIYAQKSGIASPTLANLRNALGDIDHHHFYPSPSVMDMKHVAMGKRRWLTRSKAIGDRVAPKPGWLVVYNWNQDGKSDHVGLVVSANATELNTIEFNTSSTNQSDGGAIAKRKRRYDNTVEGFIQPDLVRIV